MNFLSKLLFHRSPGATVSPSGISTAPRLGLKYYLYLSRTKVDMLFPQIPPDFLSGAQAEIKVNLGLASATLKGRSADDAKELAARTEAVCSYIRAHDEVGKVSQSKRWIEGTAHLQWGNVVEYASGIVFFGGTIEDKLVALLGSRESVVGEASTSEANHAPYYYTLKFFNEMLEDDNVTEEVCPPYTRSYQQAITIALKALPAAKTKVEFLAKVLHTDEHCVVATPLYVAMSD